jgi:hypothetical protein
MYSQVAFVDTVATMPYDTHPDLVTIESLVTRSLLMRLGTDPGMAPTASAKLELNRILMSDPDLDSLDGPSIFDIPWYDQGDMLIWFAEIGVGTGQKVETCGEERERWAHLIPSTALVAMFITLLYPNQNF